MTIEFDITIIILLLYNRITCQLPSEHNGINLLSMRLTAHSHLHLKVVNDTLLKYFKQRCVFKNILMACLRIFYMSENLRDIIAKKEIALTKMC